MAFSNKNAKSEPPRETNRQSLTGVFLLLAIFATPMPTAAQSVNLEQSNTVNPLPLEYINPEKNTITLTEANQIQWNGNTVSERKLALLLKQIAILSPEPEIRLMPHRQSDYKFSLRVLTMIRNSGVTKLGFVGNEIGLKSR